MTDARASMSTRKALVATTSVAIAGCAVCCALPFVAPVAVLASGGGLLAWFGTTSHWLMALAVAAVASGWIWMGVLSWRTGRGPGRPMLWVVSMATASTMVALIWKLLSP